MYSLDDRDHQRTPTSDEKRLRCVCHVSGYPSFFILPLILWLIKKDESRFLDHHGKESLNYQITQLILFGGVGILMAGGIGLGIAVQSPVLAGATLLGGILIAVVFAVHELESGIKAARAAHRGEYYRYPVCIRLF